MTPPFLHVLPRVFAHFMSPEPAEQLGFICSFSLVSGMFILFSDLTPKRIALISPESYAVKIINPMRFCLLVFCLLVSLFKGLANVIFRMLKLPIVRKDGRYLRGGGVEAGALAGVLRKQKHELIENVFEVGKL